MKKVTLCQFRAAMVAGLMALSSGAVAHGSNPSHLEAWIKNPLSTAGRITSPPPHTKSFGGDLSLDIAYPKPGDAAGKSVYFNGAARNSSNSFRGKVIEGGAGKPLLTTCKAGGTAGYYVKIQIEVKASRSTSWTNIGWVIYSHLTKTAWSNDGYIYNGEKIAAVWTGKPVACWSAPHVHVEAWNKAHDAGYVSLSEGSPVTSTGNLECVGGSRDGIGTC